MDGGSELTTTPSPHVEFDIIIFPSLPKVPQTFIIIKNPPPPPSRPLPSPSQRKKQSKGPTNLCNKFFIPHQKRKKEKKVQTKTHQNGHHHGWSRSTLTCLSSDGRTTYRSEPPAAAGKTKKKWKKKTGKLINKYVK